MQSSLSRLFRGGSLQNWAHSVTWVSQVCFPTATGQVREQGGTGHGAGTEAQPLSSIPQDALVRATASPPLTSEGLMSPAFWEIAFV